MLLANYQQRAGRPVDINDLQATNIVDRELFDEYLGFESIDLTPEQTNYYRPLVLERIVARQPSPVFFKIHAAFERRDDKTAIYDSAATLGAVYVIRNPLDVAVSFAHHAALPIDAVIERMGNASAALGDGSAELLPETLGSWSGHVQSWLDQTDVRVHAIRYEDLIRQPVETFSAVLEFTGLGVDADRVRRAVAFSEFGELKAQETQRGFVEKPPNVQPFFRSGRVGEGRDVLSAAQMQRLITQQGAVMRRFDYETH